jgi:hypothetical protein
MQPQAEAFLNDVSETLHYRVDGSRLHSRNSKLFGNVFGSRSPLNVRAKYFKDVRVCDLLTILTERCPWYLSCPFFDWSMIRVPALFSTVQPASRNAVVKIAPRLRWSCVQSRDQTYQCYHRSCVQWITMQAEGIQGLAK